MQCGYFEAGVCRSCTLMGVPYAEQLAAKDAEVHSLLAAHEGLEWLPPVPSAEEGFRAKAKMVVGGTVDAPTLGILDADQRGIDLRGCGVLAPGLRSALPAIAAFLTRARLEPYDVPARRGELKHVLLTESPGGELMLRLVLRSREAETRIRKHLPSLLDAEPRLAVVALNLQPEHKAVIEGEHEIVMTELTELPMRVAELELFLRPGGFFQTNTAIAGSLYAQARDWITEAAPASLADLYCGVGGFALACAAPGREVLGVESSVPAVDAARRSASAAGLSARFEVGDATRWLESAATPEAVIVNPPRRGLGERLVAALGARPPRILLYSSCNPRSLASDLAGLRGFRARRARLFDMFPQTGHSEVMVLLEQREAPISGEDRQL